jgi:hypothetical protein
MSLGERILRRLAPHLFERLDILIAIHKTVIQKVEAHNG